MIELVGKAVIMTDNHIGRRQFNFHYFENIIEFYHDIFDKMKAEKIENLFFLGDFWDNRVVINWRIFNAANKYIFEPLEEMGVNVIMIIGNHDTTYKSTITEHSLKYIPKMFKNVTVLEEETFVKFNDKKMLFVPWITDHKKYDYSSFPKADLVLGHFEIVGYEMISGVKAEEGINQQEFKNSKVLSGHFHVRNGPYLGVAEQMNWSDYGQQKGIHILDENLELEFIENKVSQKYLKIYIDTTKDKPLNLQGFTKTSSNFKSVSEILKKIELQKHIIKVILKNTSNIKVFNDIKVELDKNSIDYKIIDETPELLSKMNLDRTNVKDDKMDIVDIIEDNDIPQDIKLLFRELYSEALAQEEIN